MLNILPASIKTRHIVSDAAGKHVCQEVAAAFQPAEARGVKSEVNQLIMV